MRKQKVLFLCTQNSARSQMAEALLRHHGGDRFEVYSAGCNPGGDIQPYAVEAMEEIGIDISDQHPKGLRTYMGKMGFNYSIIVCARAEKDCPKTFPGVGTRLVWIFDDPRGEDVPEGERLEKFRKIRDEIELKIKDWLEHPEEELAKLRAEREREREQRRRAVAEWARELRTELGERPRAAPGSPLRGSSNLGVNVGFGPVEHYSPNIVEVEFPEVHTPHSPGPTPMSAPGAPKRLVPCPPPQRALLRPVGPPTCR